MWIRSNIALASVLVALATLPTVGRYAFATDHVVIILDDSGSMNESMRGPGGRKMDAAKRALVKVIEQIPERAEVGILLLNGARASNHWLVALGPIDKGNATAKVNSIVANGGTPLGEALRLAADELLRARGKSVYGTYRLIVVTDGEASDKRALDQYLPDLLSRGLVVDAIGVNMDKSHSLATRVHSYRRADDEASLRNAIVEILAENNGSDSGSSDADFELLNALNDVDAGEILKALATPNNNAVTGFVPQEPSGNYSNPLPGGARGGPASIPASPAANANQGPNFISQVLGTFCTCLLPILVAIMIFITVASRANSKRRR
jgi:uncharacterized protein YegL